MGLGLSPATLLSGVTVTNGNSSVLGDTTAVDGSALTALGIEVVLTFHGSATAGATVKMFSSHDGTNYTTNPFFEYDVPLSAGATVRHSFTVLTGHKYYKPQLTNGSGQDITGISFWSEPQVLS